MENLVAVEGWVLELTGQPVGLLLVCTGVAIASGFLHGSTGMAGGLLMAALLAHILDIKLVVPIVICTLVISHIARIVLYRLDTDWANVRIVLMAGTPTIILGSILFDWLPAGMIALCFAIFLAFSLPFKYWAARNNLRVGNRLLAGVGSVWGLLAGTTVGPGFFLTPFLQGTNMNRLMFAGTLAAIALPMNLVKLSVFGAVGLISSKILLLGIIFGAATIPGNYFGKYLLVRLSDVQHRYTVDVLTIIMIVNFLYIAWSHVQI